MKKIVIIGGGTGTSTLLSGLRDYPVEKAVIVSTADDGGSSGILRRKLGVVPPGDLRQGLLALSAAPAQLRELFSHRFATGEFEGHVVGNLLLAFLQKEWGDIDEAVAIASRLLRSQGRVVPVTKSPLTLAATLQNGRKIVGEHRIDEPRRSGGIPIRSLSLPSKISANPAALLLLREANLLVFGPGDLHTSILPNLLVKGVAQAVRRSRAKKIFVVNLMTKHGQTDHFRASDFVKVLLQYSGLQKLDAVIVNTAHPGGPKLRRYAQARAQWVILDLENFESLTDRLVAQPLLAKERFRPVKGDKIYRSVLRHSAAGLAKIIYSLLK